MSDTWKVKRVVSGDQAGVAKAARDAAQMLKIEVGGVNLVQGILLLNIGPVGGGTQNTLAYAKRKGLPHLLVDLDTKDPGGVAWTRRWLRMNAIEVLNVAGPRESKRPGVYSLAYAFLVEVLG